MSIDLEQVTVTYGRGANAFQAVHATEESCRRHIPIRVAQCDHMQRQALFTAGDFTDDAMLEQGTALVDDSPQFGQLGHFGGFKHGAATWRAPLEE